MSGRIELDGIARVVVGLLGLIILVDLVAIGSSALQLDLLQSFQLGVVDEAAAEANNARESAVGTAYLVLFVATAITYLMWFSRAYRNVDVFGGVRSREASWAVWGYVIPIVSLYMPYRLMREAFTASAPGGDDKGGLVGAWWGLFLVSGVLGQISARLMLRGETIDAFITATQVSMVESVVDIPAALLAIMVVRTLTRWQTERGPGNVGLAKVFD